MDVFLLTSEFEGTPNVVLEAQWLGLPVVATAAGGVAECVSTKTGRVVCEDNPDTLSKVIAEYLDSAALHEIARDEGRKYVAGSFGNECMIRKTLSLYIS